MANKYDTQTTAEIVAKDFSAEIANKVILTTGVSPGGLGAFFNQHVAPAKPALLILAGRNPAKNQETAEALSKEHPNLQVRTLQLDLESLAKVREAATTVNGWSDVPHIDVLVNNAGNMACEYSKTIDGFERHFATNHVGPFLFTNLIISKVLAAKSPRIVNISSDGHRLSSIRWPDIGFSDGQLYNKWRAYGQAKTANVLFAVALSTKLSSKGLTAFSLHPGVIGTNLGSHLDWNTDYPGLQAIDRELGNSEGWSEGFDFKSPSRGVATHIVAAFDPTLKDRTKNCFILLDSNGSYLQDGHIANPYTETIKPYALDKIEADKLWKLSEKLVGQEFAY
ncbi:MAG: hypothetical protein Q9170_007555 [Blastenia crenularia]